MPGDPPEPARRAGFTLRIIGTVILVLGLGGAGLSYWLSAPTDDLSDEVLSSSNSKAMQRTIEVNVGKMGVFVATLSEDWQDPATRAMVIAVVSILLASGCFYLALLQARDHDLDEPPG